MMFVKKFFSRLFVLYLVLYVFPFPLDYIPFDFGSSVSNLVNSFWQWVTPLFATSFYGFTDELSFQGRGSGDTLYDYFLVLTRFIIVSILVLFWLVWDKAKKSDVLLWTSFVVLLRYYLAFMMFVYGFSKIFYLQFPEMSLLNLTGIYGDSSPMGLLWKFMGYSETYSVFTGLMEVLGGLLLLFRHTKMLGTIITFGIMLNVFVLNMTFDVPVKLFSFHLLVMSLVIVVPDAKNIFNFFILNKPTWPKIITPYFSNNKRKWAGYISKSLIVVYVLFTTIESKIKSQELYGKKAFKNHLYGIYNVQNFVINGNTLPLLTTDRNRWQKLIIDKNSSLVIKMDGTRVGMKHEIDTVTNSITFKPFLNGEEEYRLEFQKKDDILLLDGIQGLDTLHISSIKWDREDFFLINRGFHWINKYPMNR